MLTPGRTAPLSSVTRPLSCAVDSCATAVGVVKRRQNVPRQNAWSRRFIGPPCWCPRRGIAAVALFEPGLHPQLDDSRRVRPCRDPPQMGPVEILAPAVHLLTVVTVST